MRYWIEPRPGKKGTKYRLRWVGSTKGSKTFDTFEEAKKHAPDGDTVETFSRGYLEDRRQELARSTLDNDRRAINAFSGLFPGLPLRAITPLHIHQYKASFRAKGFLNNTISIRLRHFKAMLNNALHLGLIDRLPFPPRIIPPREHSGRYLTSKELVPLFKALEVHPLMYRACLFALNTGLRRVEAVNLDWMHVVGAHFRVDRPGRAYRETTKFRRRLVPIHANIYHLLGTTKDKGQVFQGLTPTVVAHQLRFAYERAGTGRICFKDFRHTWATNYMIETGDLPGLMLLGGWTTLEAVSVYQHLAGARRQPMLPFLPPSMPALLIPIKIEGSSHSTEKEPSIISSGGENRTLDLTLMKRAMFGKIHEN